MGPVAGEQESANLALMALPNETVVILAVGVLLSVTASMTCIAPGANGVPEREMLLPVVPLKLRPAGIDPERIDQL